MKRIYLLLMMAVAVVMGVKSQTRYESQPLSFLFDSGDSVAVELQTNILSPRYENGQFVWHVGNGYTFNHVDRIEPRTAEQSLESARQALIRLYQATDGDHWYVNTNWCSDKPISEWFGVYTWDCPYVSGLTLRGNNLRGQLPERTFSGLGPIYLCELAENNLTGQLPSDLECLWQAGYLSFSYNQLEGQLPSSFGNFPYLTYLGVNRNKLTGTVPYGLGKIMDNGRLLISGNDFSGSLPEDIVNHNRFSLMWDDIVPQGGHLDIPTIPAYQLKVTDLNGNTFNTADVYKDHFYTLTFNYSSARGDFLSKLKVAYDTYKSKGFEVLGMAPGNAETVNDFLHANNISWLNIDPASFGDAIGKYYANLNFINLVDQNGNVVFTSIMDENGKMEDTRGNSTRDQKVFDVLAEKFGQVDFTPYSSTDYSHDGEVITLQQATEGRGVDLVFMGNCYVDKDMEPGGRYENRMRDAMEQFFAYEPYTSLRKRFNVYAVKAVSKNAEMYEGTEHAINSDADAFNYACRIPTYTDGDPLRVNVIYNTINAGRSVTYMYADNSYVAYMCTGINRVLNHEGGGHGVGRLYDEYVENDGSAVDQNVKDYYEYQWSQHGRGANIDMHADVTQTHWARLAADPLYEGEQLGAYEGAGTYGHGIYRPTLRSMMRYNDTPFNAPSREIIYKYVMQESEGPDWQYDYDTFVAFDQKGRKQYVDAITPQEAKRKSQKDSQTSVPAAEVEDAEKLHLPPVVVSGTWKDALTNPRKFVPQY